MRRPVIQLLRILQDIEASFHQTVEVGQVQHTEELSHLDPQGRTMGIRVDDPVDEITELTFLKPIINLPFQ